MSTQPPYARIAAELRRRITAGELPSGARVPSTRQISVRWGVAVATATKALSALNQEGLVHAVPGIGTVVSPPAPEPAPARSPRPEDGEESVRERTIRTAIRIADAEGLSALTMRRIATELEVATMSLYRHVQNKEELIVLMADAAFAESPLPEPHGDWRAQLETAADIQWLLYRRHPWLPRVMSLGRPQLVPNGILHTEWSLRALSGLGLDENTMMHTAITLFGYVRGTAADLETEVQATRDSGVDGEAWMEARESAMRAMLSDGAFPTFAAVRNHPGVAVDVQSLFEYGLSRLLDGVARTVNSAARP